MEGKIQRKYFYFIFLWSKMNHKKILLLFRKYFNESQVGPIWHRYYIIRCQIGPNRDTTKILKNIKLKNLYCKKTEKLKSHFI